jgi:protein-tyrosine-phosphatase
MSDSSPRKRILFICVENSNRSQMAEAFARIHGGARVEVFSAGSAPSGRIHPRAMIFMDELDYDLSTHRSRSLEDVPQVEYDAAITMGCAKACPQVQARLREDWDIPDPQYLTPGEFRAVRNLIENKVKDLLSRL